MDRFIQENSSQDFFPLLRGGAAVVTLRGRTLWQLRQDVSERNKSQEELLVESSDKLIKSCGTYRCERAQAAARRRERGGRGHVTTALSYCLSH